MTPPCLEMHKFATYALLLAMAALLAGALSFFKSLINEKQISTLQKEILFLQKQGGTHDHRSR